MHKCNAWCNILSINSKLKTYENIRKIGTGKG